MSLLPALLRGALALVFAVSLIGQNYHVTDGNHTIENDYLTGSGDLQKSGAGTLTVSDADYTGNTEVQGGTLIATNQGLSPNSRYEIYSGARLELTSLLGTTIKGLIGTGTVDLGSNYLQIGQSGVQSIFDGTIEGSGGIIVANGGQFTLSGAQTFTGVVAASGTNSTLLLDDDTSFASNNMFDLNENTYFVVSRSTDLTLAGNFQLKAGATLSKSGTGVLILSGTNSQAAANILDIEQGTLRTTGSSGAMFENAAVSIDGGATLDLAGTNQTFASFNTLAGSAITLGTGTLTVGGSANSAIASDISGTGGSLVKNGSGTLTLSGTNTHTGTTTINSGGIHLTGTAASSAFTVNSGTSLSGTGTLGALTVASGGSISPGASPGTLSAGNTIWSGGGSMLWEIDNATGTQGSNWDLLAITGTLTINATAGSPFGLDIDTLLNGGNTASAMANFDPDVSQSWIFVTTTGGITYGPGASIGSSFAIDTSGFANSTNGTFAVIQDGNNLALAYTTAAVPEPASAAVLLGLLGLGRSLGRRRRA